MREAVGEGFVKYSRDKGEIVGVVGKVGVDGRLVYGGFHADL